MTPLIKITKTFRELDFGEQIPIGAFHSLDGGKTLFPVINENTFGQTPADFSSNRSFWVIEN